MAVNWIEYKGKEILFIDYRGLRWEKQLEMLELAEKIILERKEGVLILVDTTDAATSPEFMARMKEGGKRIKLFVEKQAVVGIKGLKGILLDAYNRITGSTLRAFPTQEKAKEWLVK